MVAGRNPWAARTEIPVRSFLSWIEMGTSKWHSWKARYGKVNEHNASVPRDHWLEDWEKDAIIKFYGENPLEGYRRLTFMLLDRDVVAVSPSSVYRVLKAAGLLSKNNDRTSLKGTGFVQPLKPHEHWHIDVAYLNIGGTFYYLCCVLDGYSRFIVHFEIQESMKQSDIQMIVQRAREGFPGATPRIISDNGPQFLAKEFKEFVRICGMTHVKTSPYYPQSNGKIERFHQTIKGDCIRPGAPLTLEDGRRISGRYIEHYNTRRLHSAIAFVTPLDKLEGRDVEIFKERDRKLEIARERRAAKRAQCEHVRVSQPEATLAPTV
jgi:transposase InsO family protein